ncbi:MAG: DNA primase [bacterium]
MSSAVEQIKARLSVVDVIGSYLKLEKAGGNFKAKCPFHNEKTPSFYVSPGRESYHCFGCDKGGDIISFVEDIEGVDFIGALKILAEKAGIKIDSEEKYEKSEKGRIFSLLNSAIEFYRKELVKNKHALDYLKERGLKGETVIKFKIGFAPEGWRLLYDNLKKLGYSEKEMETAGLIIKSESGYYDRFRSRLMFPIFSASGSPVGFSGRILELKKDDSKPAPAKYINSPQTIVYDKSKALFGIDKAKVPIRQKNECILVEGQFDLVMSHQAGVENAVAVSGTALTEEHLSIINRLAEKMIMAFDGDSAGLKASARAINLALSMGIEVRLANLPDQLDPADVVRKNPEDWKNTVGNSKHIVDFFLDSLQNSDISESKLSKEIETQVLPYVSNIKSKIEQAKFVNKISEILKISENAIWDELKKINTQLGKENIEKTPELKQKILQEFSKEDSLKKRIWSFIVWQEREPKPIEDIALKKTTFVSLIGEDEYKKIDTTFSLSKDALILEIEIPFQGSNDLSSALNDLILSLKEEILRKQRDAEWQKIKKAEKNNEIDKTAIYLKEFQRLSKELEDIRKAT